MTSDAFMNKLKWKMINQNDMHVSVSEFIQQEKMRFVHHKKIWKYLIQLEKADVEDEEEQSAVISTKQDMSSAKLHEQLLKASLESDSENANNTEAQNKEMTDQDSSDHRVELTDFTDEAWLL